MFAKLKNLWSFLVQRGRSAGYWLLDILFPLACLGCQKSDTLLCLACCSKVKPRFEQSCPYCRKHLTPHGETCFACAPKNSLDGVFVAYDYQESLVADALHAFKYRSLESLSEPLSLLFARAILSSGLPLPESMVPVPLHAWRLRYRGFNQSALLGEALARTLLPGTIIPCDTHSLVRHRFTWPQQTMPDATARKDNIKNAFSLTPSADVHIKGKSIWLIDDISTTASTLDACARVLKQAGAKKVFGVVFAQNTFTPFQTTTKNVSFFSREHWLS